MPVSYLLLTEPAVCEDGDVRLAGGPSNREGRVEVCRQGVWGGVLVRSSFSLAEASVVCQQLGFNPLGKNSSKYSSSAIQIVKHY